MNPLLLDRPEGRIAYDVSGEGPLVVCIPGMGELRSSYRLLAPRLVDAGFRVATMDLRGHGDSDTTFSRYDDVAAGTDALALAEHLGEPAVLVGSSMGAGAAVWAAAERPHAVRGLVLAGPFVRDAPVSRAKLLLFRAMMQRPWAPALWAAYSPTFYPTRRPADFDEHRAAIRASMRKPGSARAFAATTRTSHAPVEARLGEVHQPTLVVMGDVDPDFPDPAAEGRWIADRLAAELLLVPGAGHYPHTDSPDVVSPAVIDFLRRVPPRA